MYEGGVLRGRAEPAQDWQSRAPLAGWVTLGRHSRSSWAPVCSGRRQMTVLPVSSSDCIYFPCLPVLAEDPSSASNGSRNAGLPSVVLDI